jgi:hypothetical protein
MTLLTKALIVALAVAAVCAAGSFMLWRHDASALVKAKQDVQNLTLSLKATDAAMDAKSKALKAAQARARKSKQELEDALKANPDWSSTSVPGSVWNSLHDGSQS